MLRSPQVYEKGVARTRLDGASSVVIQSGVNMAQRQWSFGSGGVNFMVELRYYSNRNFVDLSIRHCSDDDSKIKTAIVMKEAAGEVKFGLKVFDVTEQFRLFGSMNFSDNQLEETILEVTFDLPVSRESAPDAGLIFLQMLHDKTFTDCIFKIGDDQIEAHRSILAQRSKVFHAMFSQQSTNEAKNGIIEIKDSSIVSVKAMLEYMYSGAVELTAENVEGVMLLADKYDLKELIQVCIECLIDNLSGTNFIRTVVLGDLCSSSTILEKCGEFLKENGRAIFESDDWQELKITNHKLVIRLMELAW